MGGVADAGPHLLPNARALTYALDFDRHANWMDSLNNVSKLLHASLHSQYLSSSLLMSSPRFPHSPPAFLSTKLLAIVILYTHTHLRHNAQLSTPNFQISTRQIYELTTVEDFWAVYNNILSASEIPNAANFHLFVKGVQPMYGTIPPAF